MPAGVNSRVGVMRIPVTAGYSSPKPGHQLKLIARSILLTTTPCFITGDTKALVRGTYLIPIRHAFCRSTLGKFTRVMGT